MNDCSSILSRALRKAFAGGPTSPKPQTACHVVSVGGLLPRRSGRRDSTASFWSIRHIASSTAICTSGESSSSKPSKGFNAALARGPIRPRAVADVERTSASLMERESTRNSTAIGFGGSICVNALATFQRSSGHLATAATRARIASSLPAPIAPARQLRLLAPDERRRRSQRSVLGRWLSRPDPAVPGRNRRLRVAMRLDCPIP